MLKIQTGGKETKMFRRTKFYLDKREAKLMGVCAGIADYYGWDPLWVRIGTVLGMVFTPFSPVIFVGYLVIGFVSKDKPRDFYDMPAEQERFWRSARMSPGVTIRNTRSSFRDIDRRLSDIETYVTSSSRSLSAEIDRLR
jgi:phage shock protein C